MICCMYAQLLIDI